MSDESGGGVNIVLSELWAEGHSAGHKQGYVFGYIDGLMFAAKEAVEMATKSKDNRERIALANIAENLLALSRERVATAREDAPSRAS